jgi:hypothetical protein
VAYRQLQARIAASLPPVAEPVIPVRRHHGGIVLVHLAAVRPVVIKSTSGGPWTRGPGQWLCARTRHQAPASAPVIAGTPVTCAECRHEAEQRGITYPHPPPPRRARAATATATATAAGNERWHGTASGYSHYGCREDCCREAWSAAYRDRARRKREQMTETPTPAA